MFAVTIEEIEIDGRSFDTVEAGLSDLQQRLLDGAGKGTLAVSTEIQGHLKRVAAKLKKMHSGAYDPDITVIPTLKRRTGEGLQSILDSIRELSASTTTVAGRITTGKMSIHETGGVVRPKKSKFLTIPLPAALNNKGEPLRAKSRDWDNTFVETSPRGTMIIFQKRADRAVPLYILKPSITIPARLRLGETFDEGLSYFERKAFQQIAKHMEKT